VVDALGLIRRTAVFSDAVDWEAVRREAEAVLGDARGFADTHAFLAAVLQRAGGRHSALVPPGAPASRRPPGRPGSQSPAHAALKVVVPTGGVMDAAGYPVGYLRLPRLPEGWGRARRYTVVGGTVLNELAAARPRGWIVDLRANIGGNMWPMLAVVAPLLPDGVLGHFVLPDGRHLTWSSERGRVRLGGRRLARSRGPAAHDGPHPVAVLTSKYTASAGEAVAVALSARPGVRLIGTPTAGFTTGNRTHLLRDGTRLRISGSHYADRHRRLVNGPVPVDEHLPRNDRAAALGAALSWLHGQQTPPAT
jgi:carboxyl-terminal processing protease